MQPDIEFTGFDAIDDWRGCAIATIIKEKGKPIYKNKLTVLRRGQIWRDIAESKLGMKYFGRPISSSDFKIIDVNAWPGSRDRKQRTRVRHLFSTRTSVKDTHTICPPKCILIKDVD